MSDDRVVTFRVQRGTFEMDRETLSDPYETAREFARVYAYLDNMRPPYGDGRPVSSYRRIASSPIKGGGMHFTWRLIWLVDITGTDEARQVE